jgi:hypothetical protein
MSPIKLACVLSLLGLGACALADAPSGRVRDAEVSVDAGPGLSDTGSLGPFSDVGPTGALSEADILLDDGTRGSACLDFEDNNGDGLFDCDEPQCQSPTVNAACCVGSTAPACCIHREDVVVMEADCAGAPCLRAGDTTLSATNGRVVAGGDLPTGCDVPPESGFAPFGSVGSHGFMVLPQHVDPAAARIRIEGRIGAADVGGSDVAAAGFGLFTEQGIGSVARPLVAVVASATSDDVRVIVGDRVIRTEALGLGGCARSLRYAIDLSPDGTFRVERRAPTESTWDATAVATGSYDVLRDARVAMFGQQPNPDGAPVTWVSELAVIQEGCDVLAPARAPAPTVAAGAADDVTGIAVFPRDGTGGYEALLTSGDQIHWLSVQRASGGLVSTAPGDPFGDNIQPMWPGYGRFQDIEVLHHAGAHRVFLAAAAAGSETFEIVETTYTPSITAGAPGVLGSSVNRVLSASDFGASGGSPAVSVDGPTAAVVSIAGRGGVVLAARVRYADGHSEIRIAPALPDSADFESPTGVVGRDASGVTTNGLVHASQGLDAEAFDRDEVADPSLVVINGVARVLYAGRRGTRWSIGSVVASPDFTHFAPVDDAPLLTPSASGFDALGVSEPILVRRDDVDWLYFAGSDGARRGVGVARQDVLGGTP